MFRSRSFNVALLVGACASLVGCSSAPSPTNSASDPTTTPTPTIPAGALDAAWVADATFTQLGSLKLPGAAALFDAPHFQKQLTHYDPGSLLRCDVHEDAGYVSAVEGLGGVRWGYDVQRLADLSKPALYLGLSHPPRNDMSASGGDPAVEIAKADIVGVSSEVALYYSQQHGLMVVDTSTGKPTFRCAAKLPGNVDKFYFHHDHLIAMVSAGTYANKRSSLLHFKVTGATLAFVEEVKLGQVSILDSRRFNDSLVLYTDIKLLQSGETEVPPALPKPDNGVAVASQTQGPAGFGASAPSFGDSAWTGDGASKHRALHVFKIADKLERTLAETRLDDTDPAGYLESKTYDRATPLGTVVGETSHLGASLYASDRYFVTTERIQVTKIKDWQTHSYSACTASHDEPFRYTSCTTKYETRPNPSYKPADNSGGDRACTGTTLADCLRRVTREASKTISVPVAETCEVINTTRWVCDREEQRTFETPVFEYDVKTRLNVYEYTDTGFIRLESKAYSVETPGLDAVTLGDSVATLTTSAETHDLAVAGDVQELQFQNGYLYVIAQGTLQTYSLADGGIVRTSSVPVVASGQLQASLFTATKLYLSDATYTNQQDSSVLKVLDLANPAFPRQTSTDRSLPGGHTNIRAVSSGILTTGMVQQFEGNSVNAIKLGLFADPVTTETAYLILGTDLEARWLPEVDTQYFDGAKDRLFLPYTGSLLLDGLDSYENPRSRRVFRVGVSRVESATLVSEGALDMPEYVERVRAVVTAPDTYLSFSSSSLYALSPSGKEWKKEPVLEYYTPVGAYRLNESEEYAEVSRLGSRCKVRVAPLAKLNERSTEGESFECNGAVQAYGRELVFGTETGVLIDESGKVSALEPTRVKAIVSAINNREVCLYSDQLVENTYVDPTNPPDPATLRCFARADYEALLELRRKESTAGGQ